VKKWLFLDDTEERHIAFRSMVSPYGKGVTVIYTYTAADAITLLNSEQFDCVFLDHDLEDTDPDCTGQTVAEFIALHMDRNSLPRHSVIHSWNPEGAARMVAALRGAGLSVTQVPFSNGSSRSFNNHLP
jgi:hypothetical protein